MSIVSNNIKYLRRLYGLTQEQLARRIGIKRSLVGAYEEARANPNLDNLMIMAKLFSTTVDSLLKNDLRKVRETPKVDTFNNAPIMVGHDSFVPSIQDIMEKKATFLDSKEESYRDMREDDSYSRAFTETPYASIPHAVEPAFVNSNSLIGGKITCVHANMREQYQQRYGDHSFLKLLPQMAFSGLSENEEYRAFEDILDFPFVDAWVVTKRVGDWKSLPHDTYCVLLIQGRLVYRKLYNQVRTKGSFLMLHDKEEFPPEEINIRYVAELWEVMGFFSWNLPQSSQLNLKKIKGLVDDLKSEVEELEKNT